jgi:hypothetical protein
MHFNKMKIRKAVEQEKVSTSNWNISVLWRYIYFIVRCNICILHVVRHTHYTIQLIACLEILKRYCRLTHESPLAKKRSVSAKLSWT